ncbi:preprotein translocase subunit YajC [Flavobacteriaceae bacterium]|nr:preprotein translocase subunit YajC [Flavobacteriaceae bacterium]
MEEGLGSMLPLLLMFVVIYFFMIRPQVKRQKKEKTFQSSLAKGTKVVTTSGIHGKVMDIVDSDNTVIIETSAGKLKMERSAISAELSTKLNAPKK